MATSEEQALAQYSQQQQAAQIETQQNWRIVEFANGLPDEVPMFLRQELWGLLYHQWSLTFLDKNEAMAMRYKIAKLSLDIRQSVPAYLVTDKFVYGLKNFELFMDRQILSSQIRSTTGNIINERLAIIRQVTESIMHHDKEKEKRGFF